MVWGLMRKALGPGAIGPSGCGSDLQRGAPSLTALPRLFRVVDGSPKGALIGAMVGSELALTFLQVVQFPTSGGRQEVS